MSEVERWLVIVDGHEDHPAVYGYAKRADAIEQIRELLAEGANPEHLTLARRLDFEITRKITIRVVPQNKEIAP